MGLGVDDLARGFAVLIVVYALFLAVGWGLGQVGYLHGLLLRPHLSADAILDNWLLTALGEELLFCGVLFTATADLVSRKQRWLVVLVVALLFALWHLPGYLAMGRSGGALFGRLALNATSWLLFGAAYALSGNLWLAALMHANTDYPLSPLVTQQRRWGCSL